MYSRQVLEHFQSTENVGDMDDADACVRLDNPACGDILQLALKTRDGIITSAKFRARGCVCAIACGSQLTAMILDKPVAEARSLRREDLIQQLGGLPPASGHAAVLAIEALTAALKQLK